MNDEASQSGHAALAAQLATLTGTRVEREPAARVGGGCICESYRWESDAGPVFVKTAPAPSLSMFEAEAEGLRELAQAGAVRVPRVLAHGVVGARAWLALEWIELGPLAGGAQRMLGEQLARQHRRTAHRFGWHRDNTIGSTPQSNAATDDWLTFFRDRRLALQLARACRSGHAGALRERGERLLGHLPVLLADHTPPPSLLHGDLWGGNAGVDAAGRPVIFDPATYYGDREADLAMTRLFGGFSGGFHDAYEAAWPLPDGAADRVDLYNLYHVLNHLNLFGGGYLRQVVALIDGLLAR